MKQYKDVCKYCGKEAPARVHIPERIVKPCGTIVKIGEVIRSKECLEREKNNAPKIS